MKFVVHSVGLKPPDLQIQTQIQVGNDKGRSQRSDKGKIVDSAIKTKNWCEKREQEMKPERKIGR